MVIIHQHFVICRMPWQGQKDTMIDRFDGRAHLDIIPGNGGFSGSNIEMEVVSGISKKEARQHNYERYRILVQNEYLKSKSFSQTHTKKGSAEQKPYKS